jgi:hypothetical protein
MIVRTLRRAIIAVAALLILSSLTGPVVAQAFPISVNLGTALPMPIGQTNTVAVTVTDVVNSTVQLTFVGLRFEWDSPNNFFIGGNSDKGAVLAAGEQITYSIPVVVPANITPGSHRLSTYVTYRMLNQKNSTSVQAGWWVADMQFAYPQTQQSQTATATGPQQSFNAETIGVLVAVVAIGLFLERGRIKRLIRKSRTTGPTPTQPEGEPNVGEKPPVTESPPVVENKEEDL